VRLLHDSLFLRTRTAARQELYFFSFFLVLESYFVSIAEFVTLLQLHLDSLDKASDPAGVREYTC
jgi:hypothetical protein